MSLLTKCTDCLTLMDWLDGLKRTVIRDTDGNYYLQVNYSECPDDCDEVEPALDCVSDISAEEMFLNTLVEGPCDNTCAINLIGNICEACE